MQLTSEQQKALSSPPYPLKFKEVIRRYEFGGRRIPDYFGKDLPDGIIAETWEITDHGEDISVVRNGPWAGLDLHTLVQALGPRLLGSRVGTSRAGGFPLLIKFLDANETLGMQTHPDDAYAAAHEPGETGKTEAWYILAADEGATLFCGNVDGLTREELVEAIAEGNPERCMKEFSVKPGDTIYVPAGRMHAIGKGILLYEAQQSCDLTYTPFGWPGDDEATAKERVRKFVEATFLEDLGDQRIPPISLHYGKNERRLLLANRYFAMEALKLGQPWTQSMDGSKFLAYSAVDGAGHIEQAAGPVVPFRKGESFLIPAAMGDYTIVPEPGCELLVAYVPDIVKDVIGPARELGVSPAAIAALGGPGKCNDVAPLLAGR